MKKFALFLVLLGAVYLIYNFFAYFSGVRNLTSLGFGVLLSIYLIFSGLDKIYSWEQTRPKLYKYAVIIFGTLTVIFFIVALVHAYLSRG